MAQAKRRARSAGQASHLMEEQLDDALLFGHVPKLDSRKMEVRISLGRRKSIVLVQADGTVTPEGRHVYGKLDVPPPSIYPYEQGSINGKWVRNFPIAGSSAKTLVLTRWGKPTPKGVNYFKYNRDEYIASFPVRVCRPSGTQIIGNSTW